MSPPPTRRAALRSAGVLATSLLGVSTLSGCSNILRSEPEYLHFVTASNRSDTPHDILFTVYNDADESLYSYSNTFPPDTTQEHHVFEGTPARVFARVDSSDEVERSWNMGVCGEDATGRSGLFLSIPEQAETGTLRVQWDCQPVSRGSE